MALPRFKGLRPLVEPRAGLDPRSPLTAREAEVIALVSSGATNNEIAAALVISESTVKSHVKHILRKLGAANRAEAVSRHLSASEK
jgi:DNA-binding NarL/FixJ family response regulator